MLTDKYIRERSSSLLKLLRGGETEESRKILRRKLSLLPFGTTITHDLDKVRRIRRWSLGIKYIFTICLFITYFLNIMLLQSINNKHIVDKITLTLSWWPSWQGYMVSWQKYRHDLSIFLPFLKICCSHFLVISYLSSNQVQFIEFKRVRPIFEPNKTGKSLKRAS